MPDVGTSRSDNVTSSRGMERQVHGRVVLELAHRVGVEAPTLSRARRLPRRAQPLPRWTPRGSQSSLPQGVPGRSPAHTVVGACVLSLPMVRSGTAA